MSAVVAVGSCNLDFIVEVPTLPLPGQTVLGGDVVCRPGGKGANQAVAAKRLGADTTFIGAVGEDQFGTTLRAALATEEIDLSQVVTLPGPTGVALIVVDESGANQITVAPGANQHLGAEHLVGLWPRLTAVSVLSLQLEISVPTCLAAAHLAREAGALVVLNAAPMTDATGPELASLLALTDVLIVNESEALSLGSAPAPSDIAGWQALAGELSGSVASAVVVTLGSSGAVAAEQGAAFCVPAYPVQPVDTTGAGDAFCGAVAAAFAEKRSLRDAVRLGCAAGALATTAVGAQAALPGKAEIEHLDTQLGGG